MPPQLLWLEGLVALIASLATSFWLFRLGEIHLVGHDKATGVQKFHVNPTSRLGGLGIIAGFFAALLVLFIVRRYLVEPLAEYEQIYVGLALASLPVFIGGISEDLTHQVRPATRLILAVVSAAMLYLGLNTGIFRTDVLLIDALLRLPLVPFLLTLFVVAGFTHSVNIIDGFHGLASGCAMLMLAGLMALAIIYHDIVVLRLGIVLLLSTLGFFVINWPGGRIFLGDAGAYLLGFWVIALGLMLLNRNPSISPMAPVVIGICPLIETLFSMYRRKFVRKHPINHPDGLHLHTLIYRRLLSRPAEQHLPVVTNRANAQVAAYFWLPVSAFASLAVLFRENTNAQLVLMLFYLGMYWWLYTRLVTLRAPKWMLRR